jgi:hypothetical protein
VSCAIRKHWDTKDKEGFARVDGEHLVHWAAQQARRLLRNGSLNLSQQEELALRLERAEAAMREARASLDASRASAERYLKAEGEYRNAEHDLRGGLGEAVAWMLMDAPQVAAQSHG